MKPMFRLLLAPAFVLFIFYAARAQNLIPNGDFEQGPDSSAEGWSLWWDSTCNNPILVNGPNFWNIVSGTPDRILEDNIFIACFYDIDTAQSGKAWIDFVYNEAGKTTLLAPLQKDSLYHLSCYIKKETFAGQTSTTTRRVEFKFNDTGNIFTSPYATNNWQLFDTVFTASANSSELEIRGIDFILGGGSGVKLDNISLQRESSEGISSIQNQKGKIIIFPNPAPDKFIIKTDFRNFNLEIYNSSGTLVKRLYNNTSSQEINISGLSPGMYILKISFSNQTYNKKLIITNN